MTVDLLDQIYELLYLLYYNPCHYENLIQYENTVDNLLFILDYHLKHNKNPDMFLSCLSHYCQMSIYIRDLHRGQGRRLAFYVLLYSLYSRYPQPAFRIMDYLYRTPDARGGSWCDLKYFCDYVAKRTNTRKHPLILYFYGIVTNHLYRLQTPQTLQTPFTPLTSSTHTTHTTLLCKWIPRESSSHAWIFHGLCRQYRSLDITMNAKQFRKIFTSFTSNTPNTSFTSKKKDGSDTESMPLRTRRSMRSPGGLLKKMIHLISRNTVIDQSSQDDIDLLCIEWELLETDVRKRYLLPHDTIVFLDLNHYHEATLFEIMAWGYLLSLTSGLCKRFFVSTTIANWFNFDHCQNLYDIANAMIPIWKHYSRVSCDPAISILLLQQSLLETNYSESVANFRLAFLFANDSYDKSYIERITSLWNYGDNKSGNNLASSSHPNPPKWLFWNFCSSHFYEENPIDIHSTNIQTVSGIYPSSYLDVFSSQSSIQRLLSHAETVSFPPITADDLSRNF